MLFFYGHTHFSPTLKPSSTPMLVCKLALYTEKSERPMKEADHSLLVGGRFNKQGDLLMGLVLGEYKMNRSLHQPARILKVYREVLTGSSHVNSPDGLNNTFLSQGYIFGIAPTVRTVGRVYIPRAGEVVRIL